jgi:GH24 family phage-related lysozyme (muramidase)
MQLSAASLALIKQSEGFRGQTYRDVTGTQGATTVAKVNGAAVPASAKALTTNGSGRLQPQQAAEQ